MYPKLVFSDLGQSWSQVLARKPVEIKFFETSFYLQIENGFTKRLMQKWMESEQRAKSQ